MPLGRQVPRTSRSIYVKSPNECDEIQRDTTKDPQDNLAEQEQHCYDQAKERIARRPLRALLLARAEADLAFLEGIARTRGLVIAGVEVTPPQFRTSEAAMLLGSFLQATATRTEASQQKPPQIDLVLTTWEWAHFFGGVDADLMVQAALMNSWERVESLFNLLFVFYRDGHFFPVASGPGAFGDIAAVAEMEYVIRRREDGLPDSRFQYFRYTFTDSNTVGEISGELGPRGDA
jgi:hypothetical protein